MDWIYLDNNATTQPAPQVVIAMREMLEVLWANPSSVHRFGQSGRQRVELARAALAKLIGCRERELVFTSGGTESNNLALRGLQIDALITAKIEHSAIREPAEKLDVPAVYLPTDIDGLIEPAALAAALVELGDARVLVSLQWANNETGVIQPVAQLAAVAHEHEALFHTDATQAVGKIPVDVKAAGVDLATMSAHKFHGPKGVGALYVKRGVRVRAQLRGGPQERERRGGTENTAAIVGMGVAAELARSFIDEEESLGALRDRFERAILERCPGAEVNGARRPDTPRLWNTTNIGFPRLEAEAILLTLSEKGVCASAGAACSSGSLDPSPVLLSMGVPEPVAHGSIRFSLSRFTTDDEIDQAIDIVPQVVAKLSQTLPMGT